MAGNRNSGNRHQPKVPTPILKLRGSHHANHREGEPKPETGVPTPPKYLDAEQKKMWRKLAKQLDAIGVMTKIDGEALGRYVRTWSRWDKAERFVAENGLAYPKRDENDKVTGFAEFPQVAIAERAAVQLLRLEMQFGLTPASRPGLQAHKVADKPAHGNSSRSYFKTTG